LGTIGVWSRHAVRPHTQGQVGNLLAQDALGEVGAHGGVAFAGDQRLDHGPAGDAMIERAIIGRH
jgi:hypothetical protein